MYSNEDFENFYIRYKAEGLPRKMSIQSWCIKNKVSWNLFNKWYRDTRHRVVPVIVEGRPQEASDSEEGLISTPMKQETISVYTEDLGPSPEKKDITVTYSVDIRISTGTQIRQRHLSYARLCQLVEKLEALC